MTPFIWAPLKTAGLTDVGYQFLRVSNGQVVLAGSRMTNVVEAQIGKGVYVAPAPTFPAAAIGIYWNSIGTASAWAIEMFDFRAPVDVAYGTLPTAIAPPAWSDPAGWLDGTIAAPLQLASVRTESGIPIELVQVGNETWVRAYWTNTPPAHYAMVNLSDLLTHVRDLHPEFIDLINSARSNAGRLYMQSIQAMAISILNHLNNGYSMQATTPGGVTLEDGKLRGVTFVKINPDSALT